MGVTERPFRFALATSGLTLLLVFSSLLPSLATQAPVPATSWSETSVIRSNLVARATQHRIDDVELCADGSAFRFVVDIGGSISGDVVLRIGADDRVTDETVERIVVTFTTGGSVTSGPTVETVGEPGSDRWRNGPFTDFQVTPLAGGALRAEGSVPHGSDRFTPGGSVAEVTALVAKSAKPDAIVAEVPIAACRVSTPVVANFSFTPPAPRANEVVQFSDLSTGELVRWLWSFGDGASAKSRNPSHSYSEPGSYTVELRVVGKSGAQGVMRKTLTVAGEVPAATIEVSPEMTVRSAGTSPRSPEVQYGPGSRRAVIWQESSPGTTVIAFQLFSQKGEPTTEVTQVSLTPGLNSDPVGTFLPDGDLAVFWRNQQGAFVEGAEGRLLLAKSDGSNIFGRFYGPGGGPLGGEIEVSSGGPESGRDPDVTSDLDGDTVLGWEDEGDINGRELGKGGEPKGDAFGFNDEEGVQGSEPAVGSSGSGDLVAVWRQTSGSKKGIVARLFDDQGQPKGPTFVVTPELNARRPDVAVSQDGGFVVTWEADGSSGRDVFARIYDAEGNPLGTAFRVNSSDDGDQTNPRVDSNSSGDFAVVWESTTVAPRSLRATSGPGIFGRFYSPQGDPLSDDQLLADSESGSVPKKPSVSVDEDDDATIAYEREGPSGESEGIFTKEVKVTPSPVPCVPDGRTMCLNGGRFRVTTKWETDTARGDGQRVDLTGDTGYFWFFQPDNVEVVVKVLDACPSPFPRYWVFAAGLTDVEVVLRVEDTVSGVSNTYFNSKRGSFVPIQDTDAFSTCNAGSSKVARDGQFFDAEELADRTLAEVVALLGQGGEEYDPGAWGDGGAAVVPRAGRCVPSATILCTDDGRFRIEADWRTATDGGEGKAVLLTKDSGYFWFFRPDNVELVVKVLNACAGFNRFWVFAAGLTDLEVDLVVTDTLTGDRSVYQNPLGKPFFPVLDVDGLATCP